MEVIINSQVEKEYRSRLCRICLQNVENTSMLFSKTDQSQKILDKIYLCFQIILTYESNWPNAICDGCIEELDKANNFRLKCVSFKERFKVYCNLETEDKQIEESIQSDPTEHNNQYELCFDTGELKNNDESISLEIQKTEESLKNICDICNKVLKTKASLLKHNISMHQKRKHIGKVTGTGVNRRYHCMKCMYYTPHSQTLVNHMRRHDGERPHQCYCGKSFTQSSSLAAHQKSHSDSKYFTCSTCGKQFKHAFTLKKHLRVHEAGTFSCNICQKKLKSQQSLKEHMHRHYNIRNFNCEDCGATFVSSSDLLNHRKRHSMEKKAECHLCGYKTFAKKNLIMHLKRHAGDKTFKCEVCDVTVYTSSDLRRHQRVHTREKPFACPTCAQRFSHSPSLNKHMRNVHSVHYKWADFKSIPRKFPLKDEKLQ